QIFLEPEGNGTDEIYPNGFSTALPEDVQRKAIQTVVGLEEVVITRPGYAIEYDYCPAYQIKPSLETKRVNGLFFAGQINGTSGYEEAAGQGLVAGINAVLYIENEPPFIPDRSESYLGVMIDDLTTRSTTEPYRMFTSRAEYRLALREDNARDRLSGYANKYNLIDKNEYNSFLELQRKTDDLIIYLKKQRIKISNLGVFAERFKRAESISFENLIKQPSISINEAFDIIKKEDSNGFDRETYERAATIITYSGYIEKQQRGIDKFKKMESDKIPIEFDYSTITGLKTEAKLKFLRFKPQSLGQASRIEGVTPGDISILSIFLSRHNRTQRPQ
ncbi:MAG: FAD-dependent oxidoreductase, partial [bacterium]